MSSAGIYFYGSIGVALQRKANMKRRTHDEVVTLTLNKASFKTIAWIGDKDFIYEGKLYDIESFSVDGDRYILKCEEDQQEAQLLGGIEKQLGRDHGTSHRNVQKQFAYNFEFEIPAEKTIAVLPEYRISFAVAFSGSIHSGLHNTASPPPEA